MLIVCPNCATSYDVEVASLRPNGRRVRCVRCRTIWHAELSHADKLIAAAEELAPVRRTVEAMAEMTADASLPGLPPQPPAEHFESPEAEEPAPGAPADAPAIDTGDPADAPAEADETAEVESPPIAPIDLDAAAPPPEVNLEPEPAVAEEPHEDIESVAARRYPPSWRWSLPTRSSLAGAPILCAPCRRRRHSSRRSGCR
jgi:predicted Zn finger-like uncharacterized protein